MDAFEIVGKIEKIGTIGWIGEIGKIKMQIGRRPDGLFPLMSATIDDDMARRTTTPHRAQRAAVPEPRRPNLWLAILAGIGVVLSAYLLAARAAHAPLYCPLGTGCDVVQSSRFGAVFGIPVAALGVLYYGGLLALAIRPLTMAVRWRLALPIASAGLGASVVLMIVQQVTIRAICSLCLLSAALTVAILVLILTRRPAQPAPSAWMWSAAAMTLTVLMLVGGYAISAPRAGATDYATGLAKHLTATGVKLYGAYWCPHCTDQKQLFGKAASLLPYVECDPRSPVGQPSVCVAREIRAFPTWEIAGQKIEGVLSLEQLAQMSGYPAPSKR